MDFIYEKIKASLDVIKGLMEREIEVPEFKYVKCDEYKNGNNTPPSADADWRVFKEGERFSGVDTHYWMHFNIKAIDSEENKEPIFRLLTGREGQWDPINPQGLVYIDGKAVQGLDFNHTWFPLEFDRDYDIYIYFYTGMVGGYFDIMPKLMIRDTLLYKLYYDIKVPFDGMNTIDKNSYDYTRIKDSLNKALLLMDFRFPYSDIFYKSVHETLKYLDDEFYGKICGKNDDTVSCIGHTHIDIAWFWTVAQTREKAERSFSTVLNLMRRYPEYKFMSSQPQLYQHIKEVNPELYQEIKQRVREGRWEVEGAMWLEADCNLISGESMVRQILFGKRFMKEEFGIDSKILWLPDVFGYSAALPQILVKSGINRFFTAKINWNETNKMPHDVFMWRGIDGTEIFTSFIEKYVKILDAQEVYRTWNINKDKSLTEHTLVTFGHGDGGGGTDAEMLENYRRLKKGIPGIPKTVIKTAGEYFDDIEADFVKNTKLLRNIPKWNGELYLEMHRGTYTSIAKNKKNNRKSELLYQEAETLSVIDMILLDGSYDKALMDKNQRTILLNQFHDIIPGSSIKEVYDITDAEYSVILEDGKNICNKKTNNIIKNISSAGGIFVYNPSPYTVSDYVTVEGENYFAENIPAHGYKVIPEVKIEKGVTIGDKVIENDLIRILFDSNWQIISIFDKEFDREVVAAGQIANELQVYEDYPKDYDAWEISDYYKQKMWSCNDVKNVLTTQNGIKVTRKYGNSVICQEIILRTGSKRIDFVTEIDWHEDHVLLKAAFPLNIHASTATYDIQFGNVERPTHRSTPWDAAKFEVCAHKWADISEHGYGVSLINDCKYGYSCYENVLSLSLLKAPTHPNPEADREKHYFTYSLYPHAGDFREGRTVKESYMLNMPLEAHKIPAGNGVLDSEYSIVSCDSENIVVETVKRAETNNDIIVRLYDCYNCKSTVTIELGFDFKKAYITNLMEEKETEVVKNGRQLKLDVKNFEIITLRIER